MTSSDIWDADTAERYDESSSFMFAPHVLDPAVDFLADLAQGGPVCEFAIGTGRVAIPLSERGLQVSGIELSEPMAAVLHRKRPDIPVVIGDMASARVEGEFALVPLVWNTLGNLRTQAEQVATFANAARHLRPGGRFVIEIGIPPLRRLPPGQSAVPFHIGENHTGFDTFDLTTQHHSSHHFTRLPDGRFRYGEGHFRYIWPSEADLMAQLAGMRLEARYADFDRSPFTSDSEKQVSVWRKPA
ncbi:class I SAM-dependent DNA methyltransferase [Dermacoccaceae bacterium W4C1]